MKILVVGGGGREHAIAKALSRNDQCRIFAVMSKKNPGIAVLSEKILMASETDIRKITSFCIENAIEYAFIGPEAPLEAGVVDVLIKSGIKCVGPVKDAAKIETDKTFCRNLMNKYAIPGLPEYHVFHNGKDAKDFLSTSEEEYAIKPAGLTGGKGVRIMGEHLDHKQACEYVLTIPGSLVIEERMQGEEFTLQAFTDGITLVPMPLVQDHKRAYEGDTGPNTGGMGSYSLPDHRLPFVTDEDYNKALDIMQQTVSALAAEGTPYTGVLYGQFMNTADGPMVIEFNARFGDPEAMNVLTILKTDLSDIVRAITSGTLADVQISFENKATVCKYLVPEGYPDHPVTNQSIFLPSEDSPAIIYYASVIREDDHLITQNSRTMAFVGLGKDLKTAEEIAEESASSVKGPVRHRKDIGTEILLSKRIKNMKDIR